MGNVECDQYTKTHPRSYYICDEATSLEATNQRLHLSAIGDDNLLAGLSALRSKALNLLHDIHSHTYSAKYHVLAVKPLRLRRAQEKLGSISIGSRIGHGENAWSGMLQGEVFVLEFHSVNGFTSSSVSCSEVTSLAHKVGDHAMERATLESKSLLARAESSEIFNSLGDNVTAKIHDNLSKRGAVGGNIKIDSHGSL